jgi:hypothetical protein
MATPLHAFPAMPATWKKMAASPLAPQAKNEAKRYGFGKG